MRKAIEESSFWILAALIALAGGALLLPMGIAFLYVLCRRREELEKGELEDANNY